MTNDEITAIGNFVDAVSKLNIPDVSSSSNYKDIPFPLKRQMPYRDGIITLTIDYGKLGKQMECWYWNELNGYCL